MSDFDDWIKGQTSTPKPKGESKPTGAFDAWIKGETKTRPPATVLPTERQEFGRRPITLDESLSRSARVNRGQPQTSRINWGRPDIDPEGTRLRNQAAFEMRPLTERVSERVRDAAARGGGSVSRMARQALGAGLGLAGGLGHGDFTPVDFPEWRKAEEGRFRHLEKRKLSRPNSFATEVGEGIIEALPTAAIGTLAGIATGGSLPAVAALGGGMAAAGADWQDPKRAAAQTALGAVAPVAGGRLGSTIGGAVASRLARPVAQGAARVGGELVGGGAGNVLGAGAEQLAFEGRLNPRELAKQGIIGGALNVPGVRRRAPQESLNTAAQPTTAARQPEAAPVVPSRVTAEIPRVPTSPTRQIQYPDAPVTQEMPAIRERIAAENADTAEIPAVSMPLLKTVNNPGGGIPPRSESLSGRFGALARQQEVAYYAGLEEAGPTTPPKPPPPPPAPRRPGGRVGTPPPRRVSETGALEDVGDFFGQMKAEAPRLPQATDESIGALRSRQEELGRLAYDRRGDFTGDLRDEYNRLNSIIREYDVKRSPVELAPPQGGPERFTPPPEERSARRAALEPRTGPMPETLTPGRKVTQEAQIPPALKPTEAFSSREDARQGYFEQFDDAELVQEIRRMEEVQNQGVRGKLSRQELEANRFDLKVAVEMQKERGRLQRQIGVDPGSQIAPRTPGKPARKIQHSQFGAVTEVADQAGVGNGRLRVADETGKLHVIKNPRVAGNREASFVRSIPDEAMPELQAKGAPPSPLRGKPAQSGSAIDYAIPAEAMPELRQRGFGPGGLFKSKRGQQDLFGQETPRSLSRKEVAETAGGIQTLSQLGNPRFVIRNVLQHVAFGKQERAATRIAAALDWAISKGSGKPRQVFAPRGSDLRAYVQNWGKAVKAHKAGQPLPGKPNVDYATADANKLDKAVSKVMTWMNEIPDAANWQTRFEGSLQSIMGGKKMKAPADMDAIIDQAMMEANKASLRDSNFVSSALLNIKQGLNKLSSPVFGTDKFGVGDFILKYAQTPGALLRRGLERSPLGLFQVAKEAATPGPFRRRNTLLALSRVAEGGALGIGLGAALAGAGVLVGPEEEGKSGKAMEREEGVRGYSLNATALRRLLTGESTEMAEGDTLYSIDWLQPWAMNLSAGAAVYNLHRDGKLGAGAAAKSTGEAIYNSLAKTLDVMGDQSVLKNLSRYMDKAIGETFSDKFLNFANAVGLDVPASFVPSLARQARQVKDPFERDTRAESRGGFKGFMDEAGNRALAQLPGISETFPKRPSLLTGEDRKTALGEFPPLFRAGAQFSPANVSTFTPRPVAREISRLNRSGEKVSISFPTPQKGEATSNLRGRERRFAEAFSRLSQEMISDPLYKESDNQMKAAAFEGLKRYLRGLGKEDFEEKGIDEIIEAAIETVEKRRDKEEK